jgi:hypothetical protein
MHIHESASWLTQHALAVSSWHLEKQHLLRFSLDIYFLKKRYTLKTILQTLLPLTAGITTITCTQLTERCVLFRHFESGTIYKIIYAKSYNT